tara:strand:+ start:17 stop:382 length:366 start_codon:yes stop_codon:yes gene_type:complete
MAIENNQVGNNQSTQNPVITVPAGKSYAITTVLVTNTYSPNDPDPGTHNATFDLFFVKSGEALANKVNCVVRQLTLPAGETFTFDTEKIILEAGDRIFCIGSPDIGSSLTDLAITVSYLEV